MKRNNKGGKKFKKSKKHQPEKTQMIYKEEGEEYAKVEKLLGNGRLHSILQDGTTILCIIPGKMRKKKWINIGDILLINIREYQKTKADVLHCYNESQVNILKSQKLLPRIFSATLDSQNNLVDDNIVFTFDTNDSPEIIDDDKVDTLDFEKQNTLVEKTQLDKTHLINSIIENTDDLEDEIDIEDI